MTLGALAFAAPWWLLGLLSLPWLARWLRVQPPAPRRVRFAPFALLLSLKDKDTTSATTPWWLLAIRLGLIASLLLAAAAPQWRLVSATTTRPLVLLVDNGWEARFAWGETLAALEKQVKAALLTGRPVTLVALADTGAAGKPVKLDNALWQERKRQMQPQPWLSASSPEVLDALPPDAEYLLFSSGLLHSNLRPVLEKTEGQGGTVIVPQTGRLPLWLFRRVAWKQEKLHLSLQATGRRQPLFLQLTDRRGNVLWKDTLHPAPDNTLEVPLPHELLKRAAQLQAGTVASLGTVWPLAQGMVPPIAGLVTATREKTSNLLDANTFIVRALAGDIPLRQGDADSLLALPEDQRPTVLFWTSSDGVSAQARDALLPWLENGGVLVRFAHDGITGNPGDTLLPMPLRPNPRLLGGTLAWENAPGIVAPPPDSPLAGTTIPANAPVRGIVLPDIARVGDSRTWLALSDGAPLISARATGQGWLVLVHTTANTAWSSLPLSVFFPRMVQALALLGQRPDHYQPGLRLREYLDTDGRLVPVPDNWTAPPLPEKEPALSALFPAGFHTDGKRQYLRMAPPLLPEYQTITTATTAPIVTLEEGIALPVRDGRAPLLALALLLFLLDTAARILLQGHGRYRQTAATALSVLLLTAVTAQADSLEKQDALAYWRTGNAEVDTVSRLGLSALSRVLRQRTSMDMGEPVAVDATTPAIALYPLLYWPWTGNPSLPDERTRAALRDYLAHRGLLFLDTRSIADPMQQQQAEAWAQGLLQSIGISTVRPLPENHVLTHSYYILAEFPGRWAGGELFVAPPADSGDNVSPVIIGSNDYAAAWATEEGSNTPLFQPVPAGGWQRELAYRAGINMVSYALTGTYKDDQVHLDTLLQRLGKEE